MTDSPLAAPLRLRRVRTGSRLHFGPLNWPGPGRDRPDFGGLGLMVQAPATVVAADPLHATAIVEEAATRHVGLGSGTQRALAEAVALGFASDAESLAARTGRGVRSAIGLHGFCRGGLLLDGGRPNGEPIGRLLRRIDFPADWPVRLVRLTDRVGLFGPDERAAFATLAAMPSATHNRLVSLANVAIDAAESHDQPAFADSLTEYGLLVGSFFAAVQGDRFAEPQWNELLPSLRDAGCAVAQSSWGPTVAVIGGDDSVDSILAAADPFEIIATTAQNRPVNIDTSAPVAVATGNR